MLDIGEKLQEGRYRIIDILGQGGMATVYLAMDTRLGDRQVAIKEMDATILGSGDQAWAVDAFRREAEVLARLSHRGIAKVTDFFEERGYWYLVMEYVPGETLEAAIRRVGRFSEAQMLTWAGELADMFDYLHGQNPPIIFRDLKPGNVMVQADGKLKLIDFGIARFFKPGQRSDTVNLGTPGYAAPEQYGPGQSGPRSDVYSLAVLLYQLLTGYDPASAPMQLPPIHQLRSDLSPWVAQAIDQALQPDVDKRFASVMAFASALGAPLPGPTTPTHFLDSSESSTAKAWDWAQRHRLALIAVIVILLITAGGLAWYFQWGPGAAETATAEEGVSSQSTSETGSPIPETTADALTEAASAGQTVTAAGLTETASTAQMETFANLTGTAVAVLERTTEAEETIMAQTATAQAVAAQATTAQALTDTAVTPTATFTPVPPSTETSTRPPSPTPTFTPFPARPTAIVCSRTVLSALQSAYQGVAEHLGCPTNNGGSVQMVQETFQNGRMFWREDIDKIYVLYNNGSWARYDDIWKEGQPEYSCDGPPSPPTPLRGFGKIWCTYPNVRSDLGNATTHEWAEVNRVQDFSGGLIIQDDSGHTYTLLADDGSWR
jgi:serine/threonine protein kinase